MQLAHHWTRWDYLWALVVSLVLAQLLLFHTDVVAERHGAHAAAWATLLVVGSFVLVLLPVAYIRKALTDYPPVEKRFAAAFGVLFAAVLAWALPLPVAPGTAGELRIEATGERHPDASSSEVWARVEVDGEALNEDDYLVTEGWARRDGFLVANPSGRPVALLWRGQYGSHVRAIFVAHPWSGQVVVHWNGRKHVRDLYSSEGGSVEVDLAGGPDRTSFLDEPDRNPVQRWVQILDIVVLAGASAMLMLLLVHRRSALPAAGDSAISKEVLTYATPLLLTGGFAFVAFYPGLMTVDSMDQWQQGSTGAYSDAHPLLYALLVRGLRYVIDSPALVAALQLLALALLCGWLIALTRRAVQAPRPMAFVGACLIALNPMVVVTSITLWKDVPYTISVVALTGFLIGAVLVGRPRLSGTLSVLGLALAAIACVTLRHNGPPVAVAVLALLFLLLPGRRKAVLFAVGLALLALVAIKGPLSQLVGAKRVNATYVLYSHHVAAHLANGSTPSDPEDRQWLEQLNSGQPWPYNCAIVNPTVFQDGFNGPVASDQSGRLLRIWADLVRSRPDIELKHLLCAGGLVWRMTDNEDPLYLYRTALTTGPNGVDWIIDNDQGLQERSQVPTAAQRIGRYLLESDYDLLWRPAGYLYALIFALVVAWRRSGDWKQLLIGVTAIVHSAVLVAASVAQDGRYQLPIYVLATALVPLLLSGQRRQACAG